MSDDGEAQAVSPGESTAQLPGEAPADTEHDATAQTDAAMQSDGEAPADYEAQLDADAEAAAEALHALLAETVQRLEQSGSRDEALGRVKEPRGIGPIKTSLKIEPVGRAWRLGVLLLSSDGSLFSVGKITRSVEPGRPQDLSLSVEQRRADRMAASRGHFRTGEVVNYQFTPVPQDPRSLRAASGPLSLEGSEVLVRWGPAPAERRPLAAYLDDRFEMLHRD